VGAHGFTYLFLAFSFAMVDNIASTLAETSRAGTPPQKQQWCQLGLHTCVKILIIGGLLCCLFHNEIERLVRSWLTDLSWSHGFLIPLFSLYFLNQHAEKLLNLQCKPNYLGLFFLICLIALHTLNKISPSGYAYFRPVAMIATFGTVILFLGGWRLVKYTWLPIGFLVFAVPLPRRAYVQLTMPMRKLAAAIAEALLNLVPRLEATASGVVIEVIYKGKPLEPALDVAEACSGMRLLMVFLALGVAMAYLHYRPLWQRFVLLASTIPIAIFCNVVRVTFTGFIYVLIHPKYTQGIYHDALGMAMLPLAFGLYGFLAWFMSGLFVDESKIITEDVIVRRNSA